MKRYQILSLAILFVSRNKVPRPKTFFTDIAVLSYYYMVKFKNGNVKRLLLLAKDEAEALQVAREQAQNMQGRLVSGVSLAKVYRWERPK